MPASGQNSQRDPRQGFNLQSYLFLFYFIIESYRKYTHKNNNKTVYTIKHHTLGLVCAQETTVLNDRM